MKEIQSRIKEYKNKENLKIALMTRQKVTFDN